MREYGQVQCAFWGHPKFEGATDQERLLALYLLTGPHSNGLGCYRLPEGYIAEDLDWSRETVQKALRNLIERVFIVYCWRTKWLVMPDFLEWNPIGNPKIAAARIKEAREVPRASSIWPVMVAAIDRHGRNHMPDDFVSILDQEWLHVAYRIPDTTRSYVLERDESTCQECGATEDITIDHIWPVCYGGNHDDSNLRVLCRSCNSKRSVKGFDSLSKQDPTRPDPEKNQPEGESESSAASAGNGQTPYQQIVTLYHETCTGLPKVQKLTPARRTQIAARYREDLTDLDQWRAFFTRVAKAPFLNGDNDRTWRADLEWITRQGNYAKIVEGKYDKVKPADKAGSTEPQTLADFPLDWRDNPPLLDDGSPNPEYMPKPPHREAWTALTGLPPIPGAK